jgi:hypothetical protein
MRESRTFGSVGGEGGNVLAYPAISCRQRQTAHAALRATVTSARRRKKNRCEAVCSSAGCFLSVDGEAVNPARASGAVERLLAAPLAHMRRIP